MIHDNHRDEPRVTFLVDSVDILKVHGMRSVVVFGAVDLLLYRWINRNGKRLIMSAI